MALTVTHAFTSLIADDPVAQAAGEILPSHWNAPLNVSGTLAVGDITGLGTLATQNGTFSGTSSGMNTGDQTSIVGITGTKAQFDTAVTDGNFLYVGDVTQYTDEMVQDVVGAMVVAGTNMTVTYNDGAGTLTLDAAINPWAMQLAIPLIMV